MMIQKWCPFFFEELKGLSDSTQIRVERLIFISKYLHSILGGACTTTLSAGNAMREHQVFLTQNFDAVMELNPHPYMRYLSYFFVLRGLHVVEYNTLRYKYAYWGIPILYEVPALNEKGLGFGGNGLRLTENKSRYVDEGSGMATYMLERLTMMTCTNVSDVAQLWKNTERASGRHGVTYPNFWDNSITMWCDHDGGILSIEQTHNYILCVFGDMTHITNSNEDILWHANHHQWLDPNLTGSVLPTEGFIAQQTYMRASRARELLEYNYGNITLNVCMNITRDHGGGTNPNGPDSSDICRHSDDDYLVQTVFSWIIVPQNFTVYWTQGSPCKHNFRSCDFTSILDTKD